MAVIGWLAATSVGFIVIVATIIAVTRAGHFRYRGRRAVTDEQWAAWRSWAVDTHEWSITDEADDDETEGRLGTGRGDWMAAHHDLEAWRGPRHQKGDEPARAADGP